MAGRLAIALGAALVLAGCNNPEARQAAIEAHHAALARQDDQQCRSYGAPVGSDPYIQCRMQLTQIRAQQQAQEQELIQQRSAVMMQTGTSLMTGR